MMSNDDTEDELRQLVELWRERYSPVVYTDIEEGESRAYDHCADELEEVLNNE